MDIGKDYRYKGWFRMAIINIKLIRITLFPVEASENSSAKRQKAKAC
jgi:hypothetical protein